MEAPTREQFDEFLVVMNEVAVDLARIAAAAEKISDDLDDLRDMNYDG